MSSPIPVTIVTGFLGSGKTTLLLNLLPQLRAANPSYKLALLKNEFGDVAVDSQLASSSAISGVQELLNGCICCNQVGQLSESLRELASTISPDRIVIETSGSAFPATLAIEINRVSRETGGQFALDGVVSVIDVENWAGYEDTSYTARIQAKYTDLIVFNKWELCDERRFDEVLDRVGDLEVDIAWVKSDKGRVPVDVVFGIDGGLAQSLVEEEKKEQDVHDHGHEHEHKHDHQAEVEVLSITLKSSTTTTITSQAATIDPTKLLKLLKAAPKDEIYRIKAVLTAPAGSVASSEDQPAPPPPAPTSPSSQDALATGNSNNNNNQRYILNWAFGRWTFTPLAAATETKEHDSSQAHPLRMTLILARYESTKWKKKLETGGFLELQDAVGGDGGAGGGELTVTKIV